MRTTLDLNTDLWKTVKKLAVDKDTTASRLVEEALQVIIERERKARPKVPTAAL